VQGNEGIGVVPVAARLAVAVDDGDAGVGFLQQGVGEGQANRATANDQIVGIQGVQTSLQPGAPAGTPTSRWQYVAPLVQHQRGL